MIAGEKVRIDIKINKTRDVDVLYKDYNGDYRPHTGETPCYIDRWVRADD